MGKLFVVISYLAKEKKPLILLVKQWRMRREKDVVLKMMAKAFWKDTCPILARFGSRRW